MANLNINRHIITTYIKNNLNKFPKETLIKKVVKSAGIDRETAEQIYDEVLKNLNENSVDLYDVVMYMKDHALSLSKNGLINAAIAKFHITKNEAIKAMKELGFSLSNIQQSVKESILPNTNLPEIIIDGIKSGSINSIDDVLEELSSFAESHGLDDSATDPAWNWFKTTKYYTKFKAKQ